MPPRGGSLRRSASWAPGLASRAAGTNRAVHGGPRAPPFRRRSNPGERHELAADCGKWEQLKGDAKSRWGKLTNDDLTFVAGQREKLVGKIQERYGVLEEQARKEVDEWVGRAGARIDQIRAVASLLSE